VWLGIGLGGFVECVRMADRLRKLWDDSPLHEVPPGVERLLLAVVTLKEHDVEQEVIGQLPEPD
jgi:hypothetical protein